VKKVLIGTPAHDGRLDVWYTNSLVNTIKRSFSEGYSIDPIYTSFDSLIQRARNSLFKIAVEQNFDYLFFIDSDVEWDPEWVFRLLKYPEDVIGGPLVKKSDDKEGYTCKILNKTLQYNESKTLIKVDAVGTGFMKLSRKAIMDLWNNSPMYKNEENPYDSTDRMICNVELQNGVLISEDFIICQKLKKFNYTIWMDPTFTLNHLGPKKFLGDFPKFMKKSGYA